MGKPAFKRNDIVQFIEDENNIKFVVYELHGNMGITLCAYKANTDKEFVNGHVIAMDDEIHIACEDKKGAKKSIRDWERWLKRNPDHG